METEKRTDQTDYIREKFSIIEDKRHTGYIRHDLPDILIIIMCAVLCGLDGLAEICTLWLSRHIDEIELFYLPPYAPEYNPDELLNSDVKRGLGRRSMPRSEDESEHNMRSHLKTLQLRPGKISSFFGAPFTSYAA